MIVRSGFGFTVPILFSSGTPDAGVSWRLLDALGVERASGTAAVLPGDVSLNLAVTGSFNQLGFGVLFDSRDLEWTYAVGGQIVNGELRYSIEARAPYGASNSGVRAKLGVEEKDLPDNDISLIRAFVSFRDTVTAVRLAAVTDEADLLAVRDAIEAQAALSLIPTMAVRVAVSEDSGTNAYKRQTVDWGAVAESLSSIIDKAVSAIDPTYSAAPAGTLFVLATPDTDPFTGGTYA